MRPIEALAYDLSQVARVAWFRAHAQTRRTTGAAAARAARDRGRAALAGGDAGGSVPAAAARSRQHRGRPLSAAADLVANPLPALGRSLRFLADLGAIDRRRRERIGCDLDAGRGAAAGLPRLLSAQLPLPDRRLSERALGGALRLPGRGAVQRRRRRDAPPGPGADRRAPARPPDPRPSACSTSPAAPAASSR